MRTNSSFPCSFASHLHCSPVTAPACSLRCLPLLQMCNSLEQIVSNAHTCLTTQLQEPIELAAIFDVRCFTWCCCCTFAAIHQWHCLGGFTWGGYQTAINISHCTTLLWLVPGSQVHCSRRGMTSDCTLLVWSLNQQGTLIADDDCIYGLRMHPRIIQLVALLEMIPCLQSMPNPTPLERKRANR